MPFGYLLKPIQERDLKVTLEMALYVVKVDLEHKQAEEKRMVSEDLLSQMGSIAKMGGWEIDLKTMTSRWTKGVHEIYDVETIPSVEEAMSYYETESRPIIQEAFDKLVKEAKPYDLELQFLTSKEKTLSVRTTGKIIFDKSGKADKAVGILQDISDRKLAEACLRESEELHRTTIGNISDSVFITNDRGEFTYICPNTTINFGYTFEEVQRLGNINKLLGRNLFDMGNLRTLGEITNIEKEIKTKSGKERTLLVNVKRVSIQGGTILYTCHDVTEHIQAEKIKSSLKEKEILLREVHLRVKNNMAVISSLLALQEDSVQDNMTKEILKDSQNRIQTMSIIHETLYRSDNLSSIDMHGYLSELGKVIFQCSRRNDRVSIMVDASDVWITIKQATSLGLIVNELISNALKYAFPENKEGKILLEIKSNKENEAEMTVSDNGIGLPEGFELEKIDSLGLKLVKIIVENQLKGSMAIDIKNGTKFIIKFNIEV